MIINIQNINILPNKLHDEFIAAGIVPTLFEFDDNNIKVIFSENTSEIDVQNIINNHIPLIDVSCEDLSNQYDTIEEIPLYISLDSIKQCAIGKLSLQCRESIFNGYYSSAKKDENGNPVEKFYPLDMDDQTNMSGCMAIVSSGLPTPIYWKAKNELVAYQWSHEEFINLYNDAYIFKLTMMQQYHTKRELILASTTREEIYSIVNS